MPTHESQTAGACAWAARWWRAGAAELLATLLLVALGVGSALAAPNTPLTHIALCFGFIVTTNVAAFGPTSGAHMNPALTLAAVLAGRLPPAAGALYALAQLLGALAGFALLAALLPPARLLHGAGCTAPAADVSGLAAAALEALLTAPLALLCCAAWTEHAAGRADPALPIKFGLTVAALVYAGGPLTGASLNPARSLAPAIVQGQWASHWVYWVGPLGGAALAVLVYRAVLAPPARPAASAPPEELPLQNKDVC